MSDDRAVWSKTIENIAYLMQADPTMTAEEGQAILESIHVQSGHGQPTETRKPWWKRFLGL